MYQWRTVLTQCYLTSQWTKLNLKNRTKKPNHASDPRYQMMASNIMTSEDKKTFFILADIWQYRTLVHNMFSLKQSFSHRKLLGSWGPLMLQHSKCNTMSWQCFLYRVKYSESANMKIYTLNPQQETQTQTAPLSRTSCWETGLKKRNASEHCAAFLS